MSNTNTLNREGWLTEFAKLIAPVIKQRTGKSVPLSKVRLSCSFPRGRATPNRKGTFTTGQCWHGDTHKSGLHEIMINPLRDKIITDDGHGVAETVIHELLHASLDKGVAHKAPFARAAKAMGLEGKPTATTAGPELVKLIREIAKPLGDYPHTALEGEWGRKQTTRLLKVQCVDCGYVNEAGNGYTIRTTLTWIENAGLPTCPCGATMSLIEKGEEVDLVALKPVESSATYRVPNAEGDDFDDRFQVRRVSSEHFGDRWSVIDFGEVELGETTARIVAAESRQHSLDMIDAIREGLYTWDEFEDEQENETEPEDFLAIIDGEPDYSAEFKAGLFEDHETVDYPEDQDPGEWTNPITGKVVKFDYDKVAASREVGK